MPGEVKNYVPVTPEMLKNPPPGDWLIFRRNYSRPEPQPAESDHPANVKNLQLQWVWAMNDSGANQTTPIVHNGIIYLATPSNIVQALDGKTGNLIWETRAGPDQAPGYGGIRSIAIADDKIFLPASNAHMVALSARNGEILWDTNAAPEATRVNTSGAIVIGNKVLQGLTGCTRFDGVGCFISAYDINTGKQAWRFYTVPREGEPGSETWGKLPMTFRGGGDTWIAGSYDPDLNLTYWGVSQAKPWNFLSREADAARQDALRELDAWRSIPTRASSRGTTSTRRPSRSISTKCSSACSSTSAIRKSRSAPGRPACCGSSIAAPASSSATRRWSSRTSGIASIRKPACRAIGPTFSRCSSTSPSSSVRAPPAARTGRR